MVPATVRDIRVGWEWLLGKMEFASILIPKCTLPLQEQAMENIPKWFSDWDWHLFAVLAGCFFFSACTFMSSRQDYDAVETERLNHWEWQCFLQQSLPRWFFSLVLMRLYFASFLPLTLTFCWAVKSSCKNTHMSHVLIRFALNHDRDYTVRTVGQKTVKLFSALFCVFQQGSSPSCEPCTRF